MASEILTIHSKTPEMRKISKVIAALKSGAVVLYPTDTGFTLGCELSNRNAIDRIRQIRRIAPTKEMT
ncbi:MAG: Sua5/YciO/YrdC/YwlC family protein, partial [Ignavibacteria bacterium]|nr:Sua5/YciO/YrdC/YwlC family protein [Ignavibacteria bacterium]